MRRILKISFLNNIHLPFQNISDYWSESQELTGFLPSVHHRIDFYLVWVPCLVIPLTSDYRTSTLPFLCENRIFFSQQHCSRCIVSDCGPAFLIGHTARTRAETATGARQGALFPRPGWASLFLFSIYTERESPASLSFSEWPWL